MYIEYHGMEEWVRTRTQYLAEEYSHAQADAALIRELLSKLSGWLRQRLHLVTHQRQAGEALPRLTLLEG